MGRLIFYEWKKLLAKRSVLLFCAVCLLVNAVWVNHQMTVKNEFGYSQADIARVYAEQDEELSTAVLQEKMASYQDSLLSGTISDDLREYMILSEIYEQVSQLETYEEYLASIREQAEQRLSSTLFSQPGTYSYRNLIATPKAYEKLEGVTVKADFDGGILCITENSVTNIMVLILILVVTLQIFVAERENGTWGLLKAMKQGHGVLLIAKLVASFSITAILVLAFYGCNILVVSQTVGFGDLGRSIQSVDGYFTSTLLMNVQEYLFVFLLAKLLALLCVSCIFISVCILTRNSVISLVIGVLIYGVEYILWSSISVNSWLSVLKEVNLVTLLNTEEFFAEYFNINLFSYPVSNFTCGVITCILCGAVGMIFAFFFYSHEKAIELRQSIFKVSTHRKRRNKRQCSPHTLMYYELYKILIVNKGILILLICLCVQIFVYSNTCYYIDEEEFYYQAYSEVLAGELTETKSQFLDDEEALFRAQEDEYDVLVAQYDSGEIDAIQLEYYLNKLQSSDSRKNAFNRARNQYDDLQTLAEQGYDVDYVYLTPWKFLFQTDMPGKEIRTMLEAFLVMMLLLCASGELERASYMDKLVVISTTGEKGVFKRKALISTGIALIVSVMVFLPELLSVVQVYGLGDLNLSAAGFLAGTVLAEVPLSMGGYLIVRQILRGITVIVVALIMLLLSEKIRNRILSLLADVVLFLLPLLLYLLGYC